MQFRAALASLLTVILLSISAAASNCEIRCDLSSMGPSCHSSGKASIQHQDMPPMGGMEHQVSESGGTGTSVLVAIQPACPTHACVQQPVLFDEQKAALVYLSQSVTAVMCDVVQFAPEPTIAGLSVRGPPIFRPATPITLRTTLRV